MLLPESGSVTKGNEAKQWGHGIVKRAIMEGLQEEATLPYFSFFINDVFLFQSDGLANLTALLAMDVTLGSCAAPPSLLALRKRSTAPISQGRKD